MGGRPHQRRSLTSPLGSAPPGDPPAGCCVRTATSDGRHGTTTTPFISHLLCQDGTRHNRLALLGTASIAGRGDRGARNCCQPVSTIPAMPEGPHRPFLWRRPACPQGLGGSSARPGVWHRSCSAVRCHAGTPGSPAEARDPQHSLRWFSWHAPGPTAWRYRVRASGFGLDRTQDERPFWMSTPVK